MQQGGYVRSIDWIFFSVKQLIGQGELLKILLKKYLILDFGIFALEDRSLLIVLKKGKLRMHACLHVVKYD